MTDYRMRLMLDNLHDRATELTATSARPGTPIEYTQRNERNRVWRSAGLESQVIEAALDDVSFVDGVALLNHNLTDRASMRLQLFLSDSEVFDSGTVIAADIIPAGIWRAGIDPLGASYNQQIDRAAAMIDAPATAITRYRLTIDDPGNATGAIQLGRLVVGLYFRPEFNMSYGLETDFIDNASHEYSAGQSLRTIGAGAVRRSNQVSLEWLTVADRARLIQELAQRGMIADVFIDLYPARVGIERLSAAYLARMSRGYADSHNRGGRAATLEFLEV